MALVSKWLSDTYCTVWQPEFYHWNPCKGGRRGVLSQLSSGLIMKTMKRVQIHIMHAHTILIIKCKVSLTAYGKLEKYDILSCFRDKGFFDTQLPFILACIFVCLCTDYPYFTCLTHYKSHCLCHSHC